MPHLPPTVCVGWGDGVERVWPAGPSSAVCAAVLYSASPGAEVHCVRVSRHQCGGLCRAANV